ncbi:MAG: universal stress protein [Gammaproteobacteria bacterium]|nr:universal stress protein [Gammaproteobacteria bacterium]
MDAPQITPRILVTTDFSRDSETAFYHALAAAVQRQARLTLLHTGSESRHAIPWERFPGVRETLTAWQLLPDEAPRSAVADTLNVGVAKMAMRDDDPRQGITEYLRKHPTDLLVMATEGRSGIARMLHPSVAETVSYLTKSHTLMLPKQCRGFIDADSGRSTLRKVLCALDPTTDPRTTLAYLGQWLPALAGDNADAIEVLYLDGSDDDAPAPVFPVTDLLHWQCRALRGDLVDGVVTTAGEFSPDLVVVHTTSPLKLMGRMRGSRVDRVLKALRLPVLSVPRH